MGRQYHANWVGKRKRAKAQNQFEEYINIDIVISTNVQYIRQYHANWVRKRKSTKSVLIFKINYKIDILIYLHTINQTISCKLGEKEEKEQKHKISLRSQNRKNPKK